MLATFVIAVLVVLIVSAACSLTEAALYAVGPSYVRHLSESKTLAARLLTRFKARMEIPIAAILILNTAAHTAGATVAGAQAQELWGPAVLVWFSIAFTVGVLVLTEILPKVIGVAYHRPISRITAVPLYAGVILLYPLIWVTQLISRLVKPPGRIILAPEEEVRHFAAISAEEGSILPFEAELVKNVLRLDQITARDIMTPRPVVFKLPSNMTLREVAQEIKDWSHSRIPVYRAEDPETWMGMVLSREILTRLAKDEFHLTLDSLCKPIYFVSETTPGHILLRSFLRRRTHLFGVVDQYGSLQGIVTLEDVLESLIGEEIVDEMDSAVDMQEVARIRHRRQAERGGGSPSPP